MAPSVLSVAAMLLRPRGQRRASMVAMCLALSAAGDDRIASSHYAQLPDSVPTHFGCRGARCLAPEKRLDGHVVAKHDAVPGVGLGAMAWLTQGKTRYSIPGAAVRRGSVPVSPAMTRYLSVMAMLVSGLITTSPSDR